MLSLHGCLSWQELNILWVFGKARCAEHDYRLKSLSSDLANILCSRKALDRSLEEPEL